MLYESEAARTGLVISCLIRFGYFTQPFIEGANEKDFV